MIYLEIIELNILLASIDIQSFRFIQPKKIIDFSLLEDFYHHF